MLDRPTMRPSRFFCCTEGITSQLAERSGLAGRLQAVPIGTSTDVALVKSLLHDHTLILMAPWFAKNMNASSNLKNVLQDSKGLR